MQKGALHEKKKDMPARMFSKYSKMSIRKKAHGEFEIGSNMAHILEGSKVIESLNSRILEQVAQLKAQSVVPTLALVRVGEREDDIAYERGAIKKAAALGVDTRSLVLSEESTTADLCTCIKELNYDASVHGVLLFRPLPEHINEDQVCNTLAPQKDIDGITNLSLAGVFSHTNMGYAPCTAQACIEILDHYGYELAGKKAVVVGRSLVVGKPLAMLLLERNATVTVAHSRTKDLPKTVQEAEIVIACVGKAELLNASYFSPGQIVIDVGINVNESGKLVGDVKADEAHGIVEALSPVPGGVGAVTTSVLVKNVVDAARKLQG